LKKRVAILISGRGSNMTALIEAARSADYPARIVGVFWGAHVAREPALHGANMDQLMGLWREGRIRPRVSEVFPFDRAGEAIAALGQRRALGKLVVTVP